MKPIKVMKILISDTCQFEVEWRRVGLWRRRRRRSGPLLHCSHVVEEEMTILKGRRRLPNRLPSSVVNW